MMIKIYMQVYVTMKEKNDFRFDHVIAVDQDDDTLRIIDDDTGLNKIPKDEVRGFTVFLGGWR